jgi:hypothetical protein
MYSVLDNRVMYVPPYVEQRIQIGAGEPLLLCKKEVKDGNRKWIEWGVKRAPAATELVAKRYGRCGDDGAEQSPEPRQ